MKIVLENPPAGPNGEVFEAEARWGVPQSGDWFLHPDDNAVMRWPHPNGFYYGSRIILTPKPAAPAPVKRLVRWEVWEKNGSLWFGGYRLSEVANRPGFAGFVYRLPNGVEDTVGCPVIWWSDEKYGWRFYKSADYNTRLRPVAVEMEVEG